MSFTLITNPKPKILKFIKNPTQEDIKKEIDNGMSKIMYDNGCFFANMNDEYDSDRVKEAIGVPDFKWFHETTGTRNWVLYNPKQYKIEYNSEDKFILRFKDNEYDGSPLNMPINASSFCSMFSWMTLPKNIIFEERFSMKNIIDASMMFAGCVLGDFEFLFDISSVLFTRYMFFRCNIKNVDWWRKLNTRYCINLEYMFAETTIQDGVQFDLYTLNAMDMTKMFSNSTFLGKCILGDNFIYPKNISSKNVFNSAKARSIDLTNLPLPIIKSSLS